MTGRTCLITGAAGGIGRATALAAAADGARLFLTDIDGPGLLDTAERVRAGGGVVEHARAVDLTDHAAVGALAAEVHAAHGPLDVLMNVAGVSAWGAVETLEQRHWRHMVEVNLMGPVHVIEHFLPATIAAGRGGHLVNVSSAAGLFGLPWHAAYSASKFGLRGVSEVLRFDLRRHGVGVHLVCPGAVRTPLVGSVEIVGVDRSDPRFARLTRGFERHAVSPEHVARRILTAIRRDRYLVFTSADIRIGHLAQRFFPPGYEVAMRLLNRAATAALTPRDTRKPGGGEAGSPRHY